MLRAQRWRKATVVSGSKTSTMENTNGGGAATGPTIAGCKYTSGGNLTLLFNASLLGGEALLLRKTYDANETGGWIHNPYHDSGAGYHPYRAPAFDPSTDALGAMVCVADGGGGPGNATTCQCQSWDWTLHNASSSTGEPQPETIWFCETGPSTVSVTELWRSCLCNILE